MRFSVLPSITGSITVKTRSSTHYILAALDKIQIAESLSSEAVRTIIGVVFAYCLKSGIENLSKNNSWPDKSQKSSDDDQPVG